MDSEVGKLDIVIQANADKAVAQVDRLNAKLDQMAERAKESSERMMASNKATIDSMEGISTGLHRTAGAIDSLGQRTDTLLGKQHTAWLAIGTVVGGSTQGMINKIISFVDRVNAIPDAIDQGFKPLIQAQILAADTMAVSNATLEKQIAIIEKKPVNGAALVFAESEVEVDHLATSLDSMNSAMERVLSDNHIARWKLIFGKGSTSEAEGTIKSFNQDISDIAYQEQADVHDKLPNSAAADERERRSKLQVAHETYQRMIGENQDTKGVDRSATRRDLQNADTLTMGQIREYEEADKHRADAARLEQDEAAQRAKQNAAEAAAAAAKDQADRFKAVQLQRDKLRLSGPLTPRGEFDLLSNSNAADTPQARARMGELATAGATKAGETIRRFQEEQKRQSAESSIGHLDANRAVTEVLKLQDQQIEKHSNALSEMNTITDENSNTLKEQQVAFDLARGAITRHDAALQMASLHAAQYQAQILLFDQEGERDRANTSLTPDQRQANEDRRNLERTRIAGSAALTAYSDQRAIADTTPLGAATSALEEFVAATKDSAAQIKNFTDQSLSSFNDQVIKSLTTRDHSSPREFSNLGAGIFRSAAGTGLSKLEGFGLSALGLGGGKKPTGAAGDPLHVVMEGAGSFGGLGTSALGALFGSSGSIAATGSADALKALAGGLSVPSTVGSALTDVIPFLADGGALSAGTMAVVGERGPELFMPGTSGTVVPNHKLGGFGGATELHLHSHVDARGATDPAQIQAIVDRSWKVNGPVHGRAIIAAIDDRSRRGPSIRRR